MDTWICFHRHMELSDWNIQLRAVSPPCFQYSHHVMSNTSGVTEGCRYSTPLAAGLPPLLRKKVVFAPCAPYAPLSLRSLQSQTLHQQLKGGGKKAASCRPAFRYAAASRDMPAQIFVLQQADRSMPTAIVLKAFAP